MLSAQEGCPATVLSKLLELPRSTFYYQSQAVQDDELEKAIKEIAGQFPTYGTRRVTYQLRRAPYEIWVNRKRVRRIMTQKGCYDR